MATSVTHDEYRWRDDMADDIGRIDRREIVQAVRPYTGWRMVLAWAVILTVNFSLWAGILWAFCTWPLQASVVVAMVVLVWGFGRR